MLRRIVVTGTLIGAIGSVAGLAPAAPGRVVRIERPSNTAIAPRLCEIRGDAGTCVGEQPRSGQALAVVAEHGVVAEATVIESTAMVASCANLWSVKLRMLRGEVPDSDAIGVIDPGLDLQRAHVLDKSHVPACPSGLTGDEVWRAIDRDGDGVADILFTHYACDAAGALISSGSEYCLDIWARMHGKMTRTTQLNFGQCNL